MSSGAPRGPVPAGRDPNQADGDRHADKGDNQGEGQPELQGSGSSSGNQTTANQQKSSRHEVRFTFGKSDQIVNISDPVSDVYKYKEDKGQATSRGVDSYDRGGGAQGGDVAAAMASPEDTPNPPPRTPGKKTDSFRGFQDIDYSGHFKIKLISRDTEMTIYTKVLKMETEEERFVKFCHLFYCDLQLWAVKEALQSDLKLDVIKGGYPPSVCTQPGAPDPVAVTVKSFLNSLCYQLSAVNISSTPWNIDQVRTILSSLDSYRKGIVTGYEVSGDVATNYWLAGERGSMKSAIDVLVQRLGPRSNPVQQSPTKQDMKEPDRNRTDGSPFIGQQERLSQTDSRLQPTGLAFSGQKQQQGTDQVTERTHYDKQNTRLVTTNQEYHFNAGPDSLRCKPTVSGSDSAPPGRSGSGDSSSDHTRPSMEDGQVRVTSENELERTRSQKEAVNQETGTSDRSVEVADVDIRFTDTDLGNVPSQTETQKQRGYEQQLSEWSGQNAKNPQQGSTSTPVDQSIDRCQGQGQIGEHRDPVGAQTGGQNAAVQYMTEPSPGRGDQYKLPQGQPPSTKHDVHHETASSIITMKKNLGRLDENILSSLPLILKDLRYKFKNVKIEWEKGQHTVNITGAEVDVRRVTTEIVNQLKAVKDNKVEINNKHIKQEALNMFREKSVFDYLRENIRSQEVACHLTKNEDPADVYLWIYTADTDRERAVRLVTSSVVCREIELDSYWKLFLESQYVQQELSDLQKEYSGRVAIKTQQRLVTLSCTADIEHKVLEIVNRMKKDFFKEGNKTVEYTSGGDLTVELCTKVQQHDIQMMEKKYGVKCHPVKKNRKQGWEVTGPRGTLEKACNTLKELSATVTSRHLPLVDKITEDFFKTQPGQDDMAGVGENTGCLVTLLEQEVADSTGTLGEVRSDIQGLVSATERSDRSNLAGRQWRSEDGRVVALYCGDGRNSTSDVLVELTQNKGTQAVRFQPYQDKVTVTLNLPEWKDGSNKEKDTIRKHFQEIIIMAAEKKYTSVTVLLDDCERCGWKERKACISLVKNTLYSLQAENAGACSCAYFVRDQGMFMALRDVIDDSFRNITQKYLYITDEKDEVALDWEHVDQSDIKEKKPEIIILKGELAKMTSQVIVNTTDTTLSLDYGAVSASILKEAGPQIQKECDQYHSGVKFGEVVITHGYRLKCKHVFHGALPSYVKDRQLKYMRSFLWRCLTEADKKKYSTISFPALGTGNLGYPRDLVAKTMFDTVNSYFNEAKDSSIKSVSFVVYPKDTPTVKAFQDEEKKQKQKVLEATLPVSEKTGLHLKYGAVDLWVTLGQIERAAADGLLIFWDSTSIYKSPLPCSYFNENINPGGVNVLQSKRTFMSSKGMTVVTGAGSFPFKAVIHCLIKGDNIELQSVMSVLAEAENQKFSSVVLSLGTKEPLTRLKAQFVNQFHDALKQLGGKKKALRRVEIMLDSGHAYKATESHIRSRYADRLVENKTVTGEESLGATGGVQTRSMTRETNAQQNSAGNSTKKTYIANLLVAGKLEDSIEKAIQQLKNKISNVQTQHQTELTPSPTGTTIDQNSPKPARPPHRSKPGGDTKPAPKGSGAQDDNSSSPVTESPILQRTEYEHRRLVLKSKPPSTLEKASVENWLKQNGSEQFTVVCPFLLDTEALIIFQSINDAKKLLNKPSDEYTVNEFPGQTVQNLKATLKTAMVETIKKCIEPKKIQDEMYRASGALWCENKGPCFLEGSLPEIQCAYRFIVQLTAGGNVVRGNQQGSNTDGDRDGADQGGTRGGDGPDSRGNGQNRHTKQDMSYDGEGESRSDTTRRNDRQSSHSNSPNHQDTHVKGNEKQGQNGNLRPKSPYALKNITEINSPVDDKADFQDREDTTEPSNGGMRKPYDDQKLAASVHVNKSPEDITTEPNKPISQEGMEVNRKRTTRQLTGLKNVSDGGHYGDTGNPRPANWESNLTHEEGEIRRKHETPLGESDDMTGTDEMYYDNSQTFMYGKERSASRRDQPNIQNLSKKDETVTCSATTFSEICFFNDDIVKNLAKVDFNDDRSLCFVTDRNEVFKKAKDRLSAYARREIDKLTKAEQAKFEKYHKQEKDGMNSMDIFCNYIPTINRVQLVGKKYDMMEATEHRILTAIGRTSQTYHGHPVPPSMEGSVQVMKRSVQVRKRPPPGSEILRTKQAVRVFVYQENLLDLDVDAIIHGTNGYLDISKGLASKIAVAAGPELEVACSNKFSENGKLDIGDCCVTTAGNLHYNFIIHAVIPVWSFYKPHNQQNRQCCQDDLCRSILNSLTEADNAGARSVALPVVGNGHVPTEMCTAAYKEAVNVFCGKHQKPTVAEIHFVDQDKDILREVLEAFRASKPQVASPVSPAVQSVNRKIVYPVWLGKNNTGGTLQLNDKLIVCVMKQSYVDTHTAALVSLEDEQFQSQRYVAKTIEKKAGGKYQKEKEKIIIEKKRLKISDVFHTPAGDLQNVSYVLHVIAPVADPRTSHDKALWKGLTDSVRACFYQVFRKVDELKLDSVALPSFASGTLQDGQTDELWQICVEEVVKYAKQQKSKSKLTRIILADASAKNFLFLMGLLNSMLPSSAKQETDV